jgi:hypothetical protein
MLLHLLTTAHGPPLPDAQGAKPNAIEGGSAEVRQTAAQCPQLRYGLTECGAAAIDVTHTCHEQLQHVWHTVERPAEKAESDLLPE